MTGPEVIVRRENAVGRLTLNRPQAIHALTLGMCKAMTDALLAWREDPAVTLVLIDHAGERGFCAGGDIRMLADSGRGDGRSAREFFLTEYRLNHLLFTYPKPVVAIVDGITMGGGVGISMPARYRVATERTTFAMPETGIGLFPDVGGGWYLPRLPGKTGLWLALTGGRLNGAECRSLGIATHYVSSTEIAALKQAIVVDPNGAEGLLERQDGRIEASRLDPVRPLIDELFDQPSVEAIFAALTNHASDWAAEQIAVLRTKSPQTLKVAFRQLAIGAISESFAANMRLEYRIASRVVQLHDFLEGVRAVVIDKDNAPRWSPDRLEDASDEAVEAIFAPLPPADEWSPLEPAI